MNVVGSDVMGMGATPYEFLADMDYGDVWRAEVKTEPMSVMGSCDANNPDDVIDPTYETDTVSSVDVTGIDFTCM